MARLDVQNAKGDVAGWEDLKRRGEQALDNLEGIMPLNMDWTSCSSVGSMLADWAAIAAVSQAMEAASEKQLAQVPAVTQPTKPTEDQQRANDVAAMINGEGKTETYTSGRWQVTPLVGEVQGGCVMTSLLDSQTRLVALARAGDPLQLGVVTSDATLLNVVGTELSVVVDGLPIPIATPQTDYRSVLWFDSQRADQFGIAAELASAEWLEISLNGREFTRQLKDFADASSELTACSDRSIRRTTADWLLR